MKQRAKTSKIWTIPNNELQEIVNASHSFVDVLIKLGYDGYNGNHRTLTKRVKEEKIDLTVMEKNRIEKYKENLKRRTEGSMSDIFVENKFYNRTSLKRILLSNGLREYKCECCGICDMWNGVKLSLQLDHINGVNNDNRLENLRFICPNCHSQSKTFSGKNRSNNVYAKCGGCGTDISNKATKCRICELKTRTHPRKFEIEREQLESLLDKMSFLQIGKMFNVSDNAIRKRCKSMGITIPKLPRGHWLKKMRV